ncbi:MAG: Aliphatic sulfonates import ATP-binding protein SsuB [Alphaproteobacteria bacterium MarineAlpha6_Bin3]|nr:MAG: Aliphatic sulfonates import ATP-binding protein SsuB [Alphaproteobacteria bacterium MarineAlpha6_Bin3]|tara:strand:+ start:6570 stop:7313 length:744 start_codon:yes stop_codon:yes gene_type:complete
MSNLDIKIKKKTFLLNQQGKKKENLIFKNLILSIKDGQFVSVFGPSGCGKSTLLNMISGLDKNYDGSVKIENNKKTSENNISYMFQTPRLFPWLTAIENVKFPIKDNKNSEKIAFDLIKKVGLEKYVNQYVNRLSGGMQRRVAMARAFAPNPKVLLLDEPFISIDSKISESLRKLLIQLWKKNKPTIIFVTHDLDEAIELADRIFFLSNLPSRILLDHDINLARPRNKSNKKFASLKRLLSSATKSK